MDRPLTWAIAWALCVVAFVANTWSSLETAVDDAFISGRYAAHAADGLGLVYNAGEPAIEGYSNLLWTLWLSTALSMGFELHTTMVWSGLFFGVLALGALLLASRHWVDGHWVAILPVLFLSLDPHFAVVTTNGLESSMYMALVFGVVAATWGVKGRWRWPLGVAIGLLWACRPEGVVVAGLILIADLWKKPPRTLNTWAPTLVASGVMAMLLSWRVWVYGAWLPNTAAAKATGEFADLWWKHWKYIEMEWWFWLGWAVLTVLGALLGVRDRKRGLVVALICVSLAIASQVYLWMPGARLLLTPMALGLLLAVQPLVHPGRVRRVWVAGLLLCALGLWASPLRSRVLRQDRVHSVLHNNMALRAAQRLATVAPDGAWLATRDAGVVAYGVGTGVRVAELHPRALTQRHLDRADADPTDYLPENPAFFVFTTNREQRKTLYYSLERKWFKKTTVKYRYLGRVKQHYHRYYDVVVRDDIPLAALPEEWVVNHALTLPANRWSGGVER